MFEQTQALLDSFWEMDVRGFDLIVMKDGKPLYRYRRGYKGDERVNLYSCSKVITVTSGLMLVQEGKLDLEAPVSHYLPEYEKMTVREGDTIRPAKTTMLVRHLFAMQAGFNYDLNAPAIQQVKKATGGRCPTREVIRALAQEPLDYDPGTSWKYSLAHDVLAAVIEVAGGEKFEQYVKRVIFDKLGMTRSTFLLPENERDGLTAQYDAQSGHTVEVSKANQYMLGSEYASGGAGCVSTAEDYMLFLEGLRTGKLLNPETMQLLLTDQLTEEMRSVYGFHPRYGYGLGVRVPAPGSVDGDFGWDGAAGSFAGVHPEKGISLFYLEHVLCPPTHYPCYEIFPTLLQEI